MSLIPKCAQCDRPLDPYGRDGGHAFCLPCIEEAHAAYERRKTEALKAKLRRAA